MVTVTGTASSFKKNEIMIMVAPSEVYLAPKGTYRFKFKSQFDRQATDDVQMLEYLQKHFWWQVWKLERICWKCALTNHVLHDNVCLSNGLRKKLGRDPELKAIILTFYTTNNTAALKHLKSCWLPWKHGTEILFYAKKAFLWFLVWNPTKP